jgi:hypothetical protein
MPAANGRLRVRIAHFIVHWIAAPSAATWPIAAVEWLGEGLVHRRPPRPKGRSQSHLLRRARALLWRRGSGRDTIGGRLKAKNNRRVGIQTEPSTHPEETQAQPLSFTPLPPITEGLTLRRRRRKSGNWRMGKSLDFTDIPHRHLDWLHAVKRPAPGAIGFDMN